MRSNVFLFVLVSWCFSNFSADAPKIQLTSPRGAYFEPTKTNSPALNFQEPLKFSPGGALVKVDLSAPEYIRAWHRFTSVDEYLRCGKTNAAWDKAAIEALNSYCDLGALKPDSQETASTAKRVYEAAKRAIDGQCDDPLIQYLKWSFTPAAEARDNRWKVTQGSMAAAESMEKTAYSPICKALADILACDSATKSIATDMPPRLLALSRAMVHHMHEALHDPAVPPTVSTNISDVVRLATFHNIEANDDLHTVLFPTLEKQCRSDGFAYAIRADYFIKAAWNARGYDYARHVSEAQFKDYNRCLVKAEDILRTGWSVDPKNAKIAALMIQICIGRNLSRTGTPAPDRC